MTQAGEPPSSPELILQISQLLAGHLVPRVVSTAAELELDRHLRDGPRDAADLARATATDPDTLGRFLRALATTGIVVEHEDGRFSLTPLGAQLRFARIGMLGDGAHRIWDDLMYTLRTGRPAFDHIFGSQFYDYLGERPEAEADFNEWMAVTAGPWLPAAVAACDLTGAKLLVDVGGGDGTFLAALLTANPDLRGILLDLPKAVAGAPAAFERAGVADRATTVAGSFFETIPEGGDVYTVCRVLFNWDDERAAAILRTIRRAMPEGARLLVIEVPLPPLGHPQRVMGAFNDLNNLLLMGGRYRTIDEIRALFEKSGFEMTVATPADDIWYVIEALPM
jgi:hypothetical protein